VPAVTPIKPADGKRSTQLSGNFCRACGSLDQPGESCARCGEPLASTAEDTAPLVGRTVTFRSGLRQKTGLVVAEADEGVTVLVDGAPMQLEMHKVKEAPSSAGSVSSAAYRLILAARDSDQVEAVSQHVPPLLTTTAARRAFALAAFQRGDGKGIREHSRLAKTEQTWLLMWLAHNLGASQGVVDHLANLPPDGYPDKVGVIAAHWAVASQEPARSVVLSHLKGVSGDPLAEVLLFLLGERSWSTTEAVLPALPEAATGVLLGTMPLAKLRVVAGADDPGSFCVDLLPPQASVAFALRHGRWPGNDPFSGGELPSDAQRLLAEAILGAGESVMDSLVDAGLLGSGFATIAAAGTKEPAYLQGRLAPDQLSEQELDALAHDAERARRALIAGEQPNGSAASRPYILLAALRSGDTSVLAELAPMLAEPHRALALAVGRSLRDGRVDVEALVDRSAWPVLARCLPSGMELGTAHPGVKRLSEWWSLEQAEERLLEWDWDGAAGAARECLRTAEDEDTRDEALNLLACALYQQGNVEGARRALEEALAGVDSPELIINYGIVAGEDDKHAASTELARLAVEAPTLELRLTAARRALALWSDHVPGAGETDDPPASLISAMRSLSVEPTGLDEHTGIMRFLSWADDEWLADKRHTAGSPYASGVQHRFLVARAGGLEDALLALGELSGMYPEDEWLAQERAAMAESWIQIMLSSEEALPGLGMCGLKFMDSDMRLDPRQQVLLPVLSVRELLLYMFNDEDNRGTPKLELLDRLTTARDVLAASPELDADLYGDLIDETVDRFALVCWRGWGTESDAIVDAYNSILGQLQGMLKRQVNRDAVRRATDPLLAALNETRRAIQRVLREGIKDDKIADGLRNLATHATEVHQAVTRLR
jgi:hypothetical protein